MATFNVITRTTKTGELGNTLGLIAADTAEAAIAHAATLMGYDSAAEMADDYAYAFKPQTVSAEASDLPAKYTA